MAQIVSESVLIPHEKLLAFGERCLEKAGLSSADAGLVAKSLVESNLRGIDSHGIARLPHYLNRIQHGSIQPRPNLHYTRVAPALGRLNGDHGMGQVVMQRATDEAMALAHEAGAGWVAVENSTHCGALAFYGLQLAEANMIGILFTHSDSMVVPHGAKHPFCGTNPLCFTAPGRDGAALCLDMATSIVPWNTITNAAIEGVTLPEHWAVDAHGEATTDPKQVKGVRAFGDYKGSGLGLMIDVFCTFLLSSPYGPDIAAMYGDPSTKRMLGGLVGAIDISKMGSPDHFRDRIVELMRRWNSHEPADLQQPVLYPGEPEQITRKARLRAGVPIGINLMEIFKKISQKYEISWM